MTVLAVAQSPAWEPHAWLGEILRLLPRSANDVRVPDPPEELRPLVEAARNALGARDLADLHVRLDSNITKLRSWLPAIRAVSPPTDEVLAGLSDESSVNPRVAEALGKNVTRKVVQTMREGGLVLRACVELQKDAERSRRALALRALAVMPWSLHEGQVVPHALVESAIVQARGTMAMGALIAACVDARRPEPWLTNALADAFLAGVREAARLLASAGYDAGVVAVDRVLDLALLFREAEDADAAFVADFEAEIRAGRVGVPEDE